MTTRRADGFAGLRLVDTDCDGPVTIDAAGEARAAACRESIVLFLREMANRVEGLTDEDGQSFMWIDQPMTAVLVLLGPEDAAVATGGDMTGGTDDLLDASQCVLAFSGSSDLVGRQERVAQTREWRVAERRNAEAKRRQFEAEHPYLCGCGKRCKSSAGLAGHKTSTGHR